MFEQPRSEEHNDPELEKVLGSLDRAIGNEEEKKSEEAIDLLMKEVEERAKNDPEFLRRLEELEKEAAA